MEMNLQPFITVLLFLLNIIGALLFFQIQAIHKEMKEQIIDVRGFTRDTRRKLDTHVENYQLHRVV